MIIRRKLFSKKSDELEDKSLLQGGASALLGIGGAGVLSQTKTGRLTGKVTRYHNTKIENVNDILENGIKASKSTDPNNLTNRVLRDIDMNAKEGLVYTAKEKKTANGIGATRDWLERKSKNGGWGLLFGPDEEFAKESKNPTRSKTLKLEFDYDDIKGQERVANPELRGGKSLEEVNKIRASKGMRPMTKEQFKALGEGTHIFKGDIDPSHIVGGKGYKKRGASKVLNYIKNNPGRFGKEALKVAGGVGLISGAGVLAKKSYENSKEAEKELKKNN